MQIWWDIIRHTLFHSFSSNTPYISSDRSKTQKVCVSFKMSCSTISLQNAHCHTINHFPSDSEYTTMGNTYRPNSVYTPLTQVYSIGACNMRVRTCTHTRARQKQWWIHSINQNRLSFDIWPTYLQSIASNYFLVQQNQTKRRRNLFPYVG